MDTWLIGRPRWLQAIVMGGVFGVLVGLFTAIIHRDAVHGVIAGVIGGALWGPFMTWALGPSHALQASASGLADPDEQLAAILVAAHGPGSDESPAVLGGALRLCEHQMRLFHSQRRFLVGFGLAPVAAGVVFAITETSWSLIISGLGAVLGLFWLLRWRRLQRRAKELRALIEPEEDQAANGEPVSRS